MKRISPSDRAKQRNAGGRLRFAACLSAAGPGVHGVVLCSGCKWGDQTLALEARSIECPDGVTSAVRVGQASVFLRNLEGVVDATALGKDAINVLAFPLGDAASGQALTDGCACPNKQAVVMRCGLPLYGDAQLLASLESGEGGCDSIDFCGAARRICVPRETDDTQTFEGLQALALAQEVLDYAQGKPLRWQHRQPAALSRSKIRVCTQIMEAQSNFDADRTDSG